MVNPSGAAIACATAPRIVFIICKIMDIKELYALYRRCSCVTTDSRHCPENSLFIALKGASFDGNRFAAQALEKGCSYAVVDEPQYAVAGDARYIVVTDALTTYKELAREHRRQFDIPVIGITGTNGKTTTKELVSAVLAKKYRVLHTEANYNNDVGVPRTLLQITPEHEIAVVEMGASHPGDIQQLVDYVEPTCGMITNVGRAHLEGFGSFEGVKRTKGELYDFMRAHGALLFLNESDADLMEMAAERQFDRVVTYGTDSTADVRGTLISCAPFLHFSFQAAAAFTPQPLEVRSRLIGSYNMSNMLAAIAIGLHFGVSPQDAAQALGDYQPSNNRSQLTVTDRNRLIVDAYNANPSSMAAAIENFRLTEASVICASSARPLPRNTSGLWTFWSATVSKRCGSLAQSLQLPRLLTAPSPMLRPCGVPLPRSSHRDAPFSSKAATVSVSSSCLHCCKGSRGRANIVSTAS